MKQALHSTHPGRPVLEAGVDASPDRPSDKAEEVSEHSTRHEDKTDQASEGKLNSTIARPLPAFFRAVTYSVAVAAGTARTSISFHQRLRLSCFLAASNILSCAFHSSQKQTY